jgi:hypothetical protein
MRLHAERLVQASRLQVRKSYVSSSKPTSDMCTCAVVSGPHTMRSSAVPTSVQAVARSYNY